jgi:thiol-disulfide isomerase/thioredoxin
MKTKFILLLLLCFDYLPSVYAQEQFNVVNIHFLNKKYQQLQLTIIYGNNQTFKSNGKVDHQNNWTFAYPDSLFEKLSYMEIDVPNKTDSIRELIIFNHILNKDTLKAGSYNFSPKVIHIIASYINSQNYPHFLYFNKKTRSPAYRKEIIDNFLISSQSDKELLSSIEAMKIHYCIFIPNVSYEAQLEQFKSLSEKYPDSHLLISRLAETLTVFKSKSDIKSLFIQFSDKNKKSFFGQRIYKYLYSFNFSNTKLPQWKTGVLEPIIQDSSKYNLIVFSASWCQPCHELVPTLKQLYNKMHRRINITYISIDDSNTVDAWKKFMVSERIPWRSLLAAEQVDAIRNEYYALSIPYMLLVYPNNAKTEVINIRNISEYTNLISRVKVIINSAHQKQ